MQKYDNPEFWGEVIRLAKKQAAPTVVRHAYRPVGILIVLGFVVFAELQDVTHNVVVSLLLTMLIVLLAVVFS
jgi:hypothetical protein